MHIIPVFFRTFRLFRFLYPAGSGRENPVISNTAFCFQQNLGHDVEWWNFYQLFYFIYPWRSSQREQRAKRYGPCITLSPRKLSWPSSYLPFRGPSCILRDHFLVSMTLHIRRSTRVKSHSVLWRLNPLSSRLKSILK